MAGKRLLSFVPLHKTAFETFEPLQDWVLSWLMTPFKPIILQPEDWFLRGHDIIGFEKNYDNIWVPSIKAGTYIWVPTPAAADVVVEELRKARQKRFTHSYHVFVCPKIMKQEWIGPLHKVADVVFEIKPMQLY